MANNIAHSERATETFNEQSAGLINEAAFEGEIRLADGLIL